MERTSSGLLRIALAANLLFSVGCAVAALRFGTDLAAAMGLRPWAMVVLGTGLLVFASGIAAALRTLRIGYALIISMLDLIWVAATLPLIAVPGLLTPTGDFVTLTVAAVVLTVGLSQLAGIRALLRDGAVRDGDLHHCVRLRSEADPGRLWRVVRDLGGIARYSAGLAASRLEGDAAPGAVRVCASTQGQSWAEEVTNLDDAERSVVLRFRSEADDFPFPVAALWGGWRVLPRDGGGASVEVWWTVTPRQRRLGWLVLALMTIPLDRDLPRIVAAMEVEAMGGVAARRRPAIVMGYC